VGKDLSSTDLFSYFGATYDGNGAEQSISTISGDNNNFAKLLDYYVSGGYDAHYLIDRLGVSSGNMLFTSEDGYGRIVSNNNSTYRTILSSTVVTSYYDSDYLNLKAYMMSEYVNFFLDLVSIIDGDSGILATNSLGMNYPNPFSSKTTINYSLVEKNNVVIDIFSSNGKKINTIVNTRLPAGSYSVDWDGNDNNDNTVPAGIYYYQLRTEDYVAARQMIFIK